METTKLFDFMIGLSGKIAEETYKFRLALENEYSRILTVGTNNNSDAAIAIRETTELIIEFLEDLQYKISQRKPI